MVDPSKPLKPFFAETLALLAFCLVMTEASSCCFLLTLLVPPEPSLDLNAITFFFTLPFGLAEGTSLDEGDDDPALATTIDIISQKTQSKPITKSI